MPPVAVIPGRFPLLAAGRIPMSPDAMDVAWLNDALAERHPGVRVAAVEIVRVNELTNTHVRLRVSYDEPAGAPELMFAKLPPLDPARRGRVGEQQHGTTGVALLRPPRATLTMHVPRCTQRATTTTTARSCSCSKTSTTQGAQFPTARVASRPTRRRGPSRISPSSTCSTRIRRSARPEAAWVPDTTPGSAYGATLLQYGLDHHRDRLSPDFAAIAEIYIEHDDALQALWRRGPATVIHGDPHLGNLFDDHGRTGFLDWGLIRVSTPMRDVSYFMNMALDIDDRRENERDLLRHYLDVRGARGGAEITLNEAWLAHRVHTAYLVPASCQVVTFPENMSEQRRIFSEAFFARTEAALADLEARAALRDAAGL